MLSALRNFSALHWDFSASTFSAGDGVSWICLTIKFWQILFINLSLNHFVNYSGYYIRNHQRSWWGRMKSFPKFRCSNPGVSRPKTIRMLLTKVVEKMVTKLVRRPVSTSLSWNVRNDSTADLVRGTLITIMSVDTKDMLLN